MTMKKKIIYLKFIINNNKLSLELPNILIFHFCNQSQYRLETKKRKSSWI